MEGFPSGQRGQTVNLLRKLRRFESFSLHQIQDIDKGGCSSMVEQKPSKLNVRVRFPSPAPILLNPCGSGVEHSLGKGEVGSSNLLMGTKGDGDSCSK